MFLICLSDNIWGRGCLISTKILSPAPSADHVSTNNNTLEKTQSESFGERKAEGLFYAWKQNKPSLREGGLRDLLTEHGSLNPKTMLITKSSFQTLKSRSLVVRS